MGTYTTQDIQTQITRISGSIAGMRSAITAKGVTVPAQTKISNYPDLIYYIGGAPSILLSTPASYTLTYKPQSFTIIFVANKDWTITSSANWCTLSSGSGTAGMQTIQATLAENETLYDRECTITIATGSRVLHYQYISVTQPALHDEPVEKIRASADCWIQAPQGFKYASKMEIKYECSNNDKYLFGVRSNCITLNFLHRDTASNTSYFRFPDCGTSGAYMSFNQYVVQNNTPYVMVVDNIDNAVSNRFVLTFNGQNYTKTRVSSGWDDTLPLYFFNQGNVTTGTPEFDSSKSNGIAIYYIKMWTDGVLVMDLVPVQKDRNTLCFYDNVSNTYVYNGGSGTFYSY